MGWSNSTSSVCASTTCAPLNATSKPSCILQAELGGEGAQSLNRTTRRQNQADARTLRREQGLARTGRDDLLVVRESAVDIERDRLDSHGAYPFSSLRSWDYPYPPHAICRGSCGFPWGQRLTPRLGAAPPYSALESIPRPGRCEGTSNAMRPGLETSISKPGRQARGSGRVRPTAYLRVAR